ncbi:hypothetical protein N8Z80_02425 [Litorivicinus sp.]|nr:hypothetical protein [Litorivicinus sp.]
MAAVAGTVAWEAALRERPALPFGSARYKECKSIFIIHTLQDVKDVTGR